MRRINKVEEKAALKKINQKRILTVLKLGNIYWQIWFDWLTSLFNKIQKTNYIQMARNMHNFFNYRGIRLAATTSSYATSLEKVQSFRKPIFLYDICLPWKKVIWSVTNEVLSEDSSVHLSRAEELFGRTLLFWVWVTAFLPSPDPDHRFLWTKYTGYDDDDVTKYSTRRKRKLIWTWFLLIERGVTSY